MDDPQVPAAPLLPSGGEPTNAVAERRSKRMTAKLQDQAVAVEQASRLEEEQAKREAEAKAEAEASEKTACWCRGAEYSKELTVADVVALKKERGESQVAMLRHMHELGFKSNKTINSNTLCLYLNSGLKHISLARWRIFQPALIAWKANRAHDKGCNVMHAVSKLAVSAMAPGKGKGKGRGRGRPKGSKSSKKKKASSRSGSSGNGSGGAPALAGSHGSIQAQLLEGHCEICRRPAEPMTPTRTRKRGEKGRSKTVQFKPPSTPYVLKCAGSASCMAVVHLHCLDALRNAGIRPHGEPESRATTVEAATAAGPTGETEGSSSAAAAGSAAAAAAAPSTVSGGRVGSEPAAWRCGACLGDRLPRRLPMAGRYEKKEKARSRRQGEDDASAPRCKGVSLAAFQHLFAATVPASMNPPPPLSTSTAASVSSSFSASSSSSSSSSGAFGSSQTSGALQDIMARTHLHKHPRPFLPPPQLSDDDEDSTSLDNGDGQWLAATGAAKGASASSAGAGPGGGRGKRRRRVPAYLKGTTADVPDEPEAPPSRSRSRAGRIRKPAKKSDLGASSSSSSSSPSSDEDEKGRGRRQTSKKRKRATKNSPTAATKTGRKRKNKKKSTAATKKAKKMKRKEEEEEEEEDEEDEGADEGADAAPPRVRENGDNDSDEDDDSEPEQRYLLGYRSGTVSTRRDVDDGEDTARVEAKFAAPAVVVPDGPRAKVRALMAAGGLAASAGPGPGPGPGSEGESEGETSATASISTAMLADKLNVVVGNLDMWLNGGRLYPGVVAAGEAATAWLDPTSAVNNKDHLAAEPSDGVDSAKKDAERFMAARGLKRSDVAKEIGGVSDATLWHWLRGTNTHRASVKLADTKMRLWVADQRQLAQAEKTAALTAMTNGGGGAKADASSGGLGASDAAGANADAAASTGRSGNASATSTRDKTGAAEDGNSTDAMAGGSDSDGDVVEDAAGKVRRVMEQMGLSRTGLSRYLSLPPTKFGPWLHNKQSVKGSPLDPSDIAKVTTWADHAVENLTMRLEARQRIRDVGLSLDNMSRLLTPIGYARPALTQALRGERGSRTANAIAASIALRAWMEVGRAGGDGVLAARVEFAKAMDVASVSPEEVAKRNKLKIRKRKRRFKQRKKKKKKRRKVKEKKRKEEVMPEDDTDTTNTERGGPGTSIIMLASSTTNTSANANKVEEIEHQRRQQEELVLPAATGLLGLLQAAALQRNLAAANTTKEKKEVFEPKKEQVKLLSFPLGHSNNSNNNNGDASRGRGAEKVKDTDKAPEEPVTMMDVSPPL